MDIFEATRSSSRGSGATHRSSAPICGSSTSGSREPVRVPARDVLPLDPALAAVCAGRRCAGGVRRRRSAHRELRHLARRRRPLDLGRQRCRRSVQSAVHARSRPARDQRVAWPTAAAAVLLSAARHAATRFWRATPNALRARRTAVRPGRTAPVAARHRAERPPRSRRVLDNASDAADRPRGAAAPRCVPFPDPACRIASSVAWPASAASAGHVSWRSPSGAEADCSRGQGARAFGGGVAEPRAGPAPARRAARTGGPRPATRCSRSRIAGSSGVSRPTAHDRARRPARTAGRENCCGRWAGKPRTCTSGRTGPRFARICAGGRAAGWLRPRCG